MNIPDSIRIGAVDYDIVYKEGLYDEGQQLMGCIDFMNSEISLDDKLQKKQCLELTFLHEVVHGMLYSVQSEHTYNETLIEEISKALHQVIRDNPDIFRIGEGDE